MMMSSFRSVLVIVPPVLFAIISLQQVLRKNGEKVMNSLLAGCPPSMCACR